jgi:hypothetical protein
VATASPTMTNVGIAPISARSATTVNTTAATSDRLTLGTTTPTTASPIRVETTASGAVVVTNARSQSAFQRFLTAIGLRRSPVTASTKP